MSLLTAVSTALLVAWPSILPPAGAADTSVRATSSVTVVTAAPALASDDPDSLGAGIPAGVAGAVPLTAARPVALSRLPAPDAIASTDTVPKKRAKAVVYSDAYGKRLAVHKTLSWAMLPLFAVSYLSGDQLIKKGADAPDWARSVHPVAASSTAVLFGVNAVTGTWNLWDSRHDPNGRVKRIAHGALFMIASGGFAYTGSKLAEDAQEKQVNRNAHRNLAIASMGVSTASWLIMLIGN